MIHSMVIVFLLLSSLFALTHTVAVAASLYWYYWWFDIFMHLWGGMLIGLGLHALATLKIFNFRPTYPITIVVLILVTGSWEIFERSVGLFDSATYVIDTAKDVVVGFSGGLLAHIFLRRYRME